MFPLFSCSYWPPLAHLPGYPLQSEPFQCDQCGVPFGRKFDLKRHTASVHDRVRAFVCPRCHQRFAQKTNMMRHVERVHRQS
eukprot:contig_46343_g10180